MVERKNSSREIRLLICDIVAKLAELILAVHKSSRIAWRAAVL